MQKKEMEKRGFTLEEACEYVGGISRPMMHKLLAQGEISSFHIGTRRYFTREILDTWIDQRVESAQE